MRYWMEKRIWLFRLIIKKLLFIKINLMETNKKTAIITWWTAGIGYWIAEVFAKNWINLVLSYFHNDTRAQGVWEKLSKYWIKVLVIKADSGNKSDLERLFMETKNALGKVEILVNNIWAWFPDDHDTNEWESTFHHHMMGTVNATELFKNQLWEDQWCIINISSVLGVEPLLQYKWARLEAYCCMKSAIIMYTKITANKFNWKIRVNAIAPWNTQTEWWWWADEKFKEARRKGTLIHRFIQPMEIWKTALHLLDNDAINWQVFVVDWWVVWKWYE